MNPEELTEMLEEVYGLPTEITLPIGSKCNEETVHKYIKAKLETEYEYPVLDYKISINPIDLTVTVKNISWDLG